MKKDSAPPKIWIDLENSPHVPFFLPIIAELEKRGFSIVLTARDCFQTCELADMAGLNYRKIGRHYGKHLAAKFLGLGFRVLQLFPVIYREKPTITVSHGSRSLIVLSAMMKIPSVNLMDYEFADHRITGLVGSPHLKWMMVPEVISIDVFKDSGILPSQILHYPGIKEDVYVPFFKPQSGLKEELGLEDHHIIVTIRPPATEAHYHNPESENLLSLAFDKLCAQPNVKIILLPRTHHQEDSLRSSKPDMFVQHRIVVPSHAVNGLDLIWHSDLVISGGGTMNREAAALGIPVYSLFRGTLGAVDKSLAADGRLVLLQSEEDIQTKLKIQKRAAIGRSEEKNTKTLQVIVDQITSIMERRARA